jgi:hypothetical protein
MPMPKPGHPLRKLNGFPSGATDELRQYSVTTAEEFLGLAEASREALEQLLKVDSARLDALLQIATDVVGPKLREEMARANGTKYCTGHDAPPTGRKTF